MPHAPTVDHMQYLLASLSAPMIVAQYGDGVRVISTSLPGKAVCAVLKPAEDGVVRVVYDPEKPHARWHLRAMLRSWCQEHGKEPCDPAAQPDSVEFLALT